MFTTFKFRIHVSSYAFTPCVKQKLSTKVGCKLPWDNVTSGDAKHGDIDGDIVGDDIGPYSASQASPSAPDCHSLKSLRIFTSSLQWTTEPR